MKSFSNVWIRRKSHLGKIDVTLFAGQILLFYKLMTYLVLSLQLTQTQNFTAFHVNIQQSSLVGEALRFLPVFGSPSAQYGSDLEVQVLIKTNAVNRGGTRIRKMHKSLRSQARVNVSHGAGRREWCTITEVSRQYWGCLQAGIVHDRIGIMAPFVSQVKEISSSLNRKAVEVSTVDRFQGRDKDVVIYSCTKSVENVASSRKTEVCGDISKIFRVFFF